MLNSSTKVFDSDDIKQIIFGFLPLKCNSCKTYMNRTHVDSTRHLYNNYKWRSTENEYCKGYCNWCCIYVFNHPY